MPHFPGCVALPRYELRLSGAIQGEDFFGPLLPFFWGGPFISVGRGPQELGTVTGTVVAGRARIVVAVAKRRTIVALGLLPVVLASQKCLQSQGSGGSWCRRFWLRLLSSHLRRAPLFFLACFCLFFTIVFVWSLFRVWASGF